MEKVGAWVRWMRPWVCLLVVLATLSAAPATAREM